MGSAKGIKLFSFQAMILRTGFQIFACHWIWTLWGALVEEGEELLIPWHTLTCKSVISLHCSVPEIIPHAIYLLSAGLNTSVALKGLVFFKHLQCFFFLILNLPFIDILTKIIINLFIVKVSNCFSKWVCNKIYSAYHILCIQGSFWLKWKL